MTKKALFLRLSPKKVDLIPEKVVCIPKKVDSIPRTVDLVHFALILADAIHASLFISPESHSGKSLYNTIIFQLSPQTFAHLTKNNYLCTRNESTPWDYVFKGGRLQDIIKASIALCDWHFEISQISKTPNALQHFDVLGICISISVHAIARRVRYCTYRRGLQCCCSGVKAMREPRNAEQQ